MLIFLLITYVSYVIIIASEQEAFKAAKQISEKIWGKKGEDYGKGE